MVKSIIVAIAVLSSLVFVGLGASALADDQLLLSNNPSLSVAVKNQTDTPILINGVELASGNSTKPLSISSLSTLKLSNNSIMLEYNALDHTLELSPTLKTAQIKTDCMKVNDSTISLTQHQIINIQSGSSNSVKLNIVSCAA